MPIIRINNYIDESVSSESEYSLSPIRYPYQREIQLNNRNISENLTYSPSSNSGSSYTSTSSNELDENELSIQVNENDIENNLSEIVNNNDYETCLICTENFKDICLLRCGHVICLNCLIKWFRTSRTCPFCREEINNLNMNHFYNRVNSGIRNNYDTDDEEVEKCFTCRTFERAICYSSLIYFTYSLLQTNYTPN